MLLAFAACICVCLEGLPIWQVYAAPDVLMRTCERAHGSMPLPKHALINAPCACASPVGKEQRELCCPVLI